MLLHETFAQGHARFGRPSRPDFLLHPGELLELARRHDLTVVAYEDGVLPDPPRRVQRIAALRKPAEFPPLPASLEFTDHKDLST